MSTEPRYVVRPSDMLELRWEVWDTLLQRFCSDPYMHPDLAQEVADYKNAEETVMTERQHRIATAYSVQALYVSVYTFPNVPTPNNAGAPRD